MKLILLFYYFFLGYKGQGERETSFETYNEETNIWEILDFKLTIG